MRRNRFTGRVVVFSLGLAGILAFLPASVSGRMGGAPKAVAVSHAGTGPRISPGGDFDSVPPRCRRVASASALEIAGAAVDNLSIYFVSLSEDADNVTLEVDPIGSDPTEVHFRVVLIDPSSSGHGVVTVYDGSSNTCTLEADFRDVPPGPVSGFEICSSDRSSLVIDNASATPAGPSACSVNLYTSDEPALPPGYELAPAVPTALLRRGESEVMTIDSPISGDTRMELTTDAPFDPRLRLLLSSADAPGSFLLGGAASGVFVDVTRSLSGGVQTILIGCGEWSPVKVTFALQSEICNGLDDDGDGLIDEGLPVDDPSVDDDGDGFALCPGAQGVADCNDQLAFIHPGALEICNGLDDDCNGEIDDDCVDAVRSYISLASDQFLGGVTRRQQDVYVLPGTEGRIEPFAEFLPDFVGLDALDVLSGGDLLFSVRTNGGVHHGGGFIVLRQDRIYRYERASGVITEVVDWTGREIGSLDALDHLEDGSMVFSTATLRGVRHAGGYIVLRPENAYRFDPRTGTIELLFDGRLLGLPDLDAVEVFSSPADHTGILRVAFSTATNRLVHTPAGVLYLKQQNAYVYDAKDGSLRLLLDGEAAGLRSLDGFSMSTETTP